MKILTIGDSWTYGSESSDPKTKSWPAQMAQHYGVEVVNLARPGASNQRAARIGIEELCKNPSYDYVIWNLCPPSRLEVLNMGKWYQIFPDGMYNNIDKIFTEFWHPWNDIQYTVMQCFYFFNSLKALGVPLYSTGFSFMSDLYKKEISWIDDYQSDHNFVNLGIPEEITDNISSNDLDRKLQSLKAIHCVNLSLQPEYLHDQEKNWFRAPEIQSRYGFKFPLKTQGHPDDAGYLAMAHFFAEKIGL